MLKFSILQTKSVPLFIKGITKRGFMSMPSSEYFFSGTWFVRRNLCMGMTTSAKTCNGIRCIKLSGLLFFKLSKQKTSDYYQYSGNFQNGDFIPKNKIGEQGCKNGYQI
jgi:hypothetical protein